MYQCFPVKKIAGETEEIAINRAKLQTARIAAFSLLLPLITSISASTAWAQNSIELNRVTGVREGHDKTYIELTTEKKTALPRPIIKILPQDNGDTVMVADFVGLSWQQPTRVISNGTGFGAHQKGIKVIRAGSFQERPPICRIAITSSDKNMLSRVNFGAGPGRMTISWPKTETRTAGFAEPFATRGETQTTHRSAPIRRIELQTPQSTTPQLAIRTSQADAPPVAPQPSRDSSQFENATPRVASHDLPLRLAPIPNDGAGDRIADQNESGIQRSAERSAPSQSAPIVPLQAEAQRLDSFAPAPAAAPKAKAKSAPSPNQTQPALGAARQVTSSSQPQPPKGSKQATSTPAPLAGTSKQASPKQPTAGNPNPKQPEGRRQSSRQKIAMSNASMPPTAPKRASKSNSDDNLAENTNDEPDKSTKKKKGLLSSLFSKVKHTFAFDEPDDAEGEDAQADAQNSQIDDDLQGVANSKIPTAPVRPTSGQGGTKMTAVSPPENELVRQEPPQVEILQGGGGTTVRITAAGNSDLNFRSFKLDEPARFVVDFDNLRSLSEATIAQPERTNQLLGVRVGAPEAGTSKGRLVLDLASSEVTVIPSDPGKPNVVAFVIGTSRDPLTGLSPKTGATVVLDPGHGGTDPGAQRGSIQEKELTLAIAKATQRILQGRGIKVVMTRDSDAFISLQDRVNITNTIKPDLFLSVHINAMESTNAIYGIETYYQNTVSQALASSVHDSLVSELEAPDRRIRKARFFVINRTEVPAVLAEVGFISNKVERDRLVAADYQNKIAGALAKGVILYLNQQAGATNHLAQKAPARERSSEAGSDNLKVASDKEKRVDTGVPSVSRLAQKGLSIHQK